MDILLFSFSSVIFFILLIFFLWLDYRNASPTQKRIWELNGKMHKYEGWYGFRHDVFTDREHKNYLKLKAERAKLIETALTKENEW